MLLSLIMPVKNGGLFIKSALQSLDEIKSEKFELIIVNDNSDDSTLEIANNYKQNSTYNIKIINNQLYGKVNALNYGFIHSSGEWIKCIDSDDLLKTDYYSYIINNLDICDAHCHNALIVDRNCNVLNDYIINKNIFSKSYNNILTDLISIPRWSWSFKKEIGNKIFPIPTNLPFEDLWFSLVIKKFAKNITYSPYPFYLYRQHDNQTYGGILNYDEDLIRFRAKRIKKYYEILTKENSILYDDFSVVNEKLLNTYKYYEILSKNKYTINEILKLPINKIVKIIIFKKFNKLLPILKKVQWWLEKFKK